MPLTSLKNSLRTSPPPSRRKAPEKSSEQLERVELSRTTDLRLTNTIAAMSALALTVAPQVAQGAEQVIEQPLDTSLSHQESQVLETLRAPKERLRIGDWQLHVDPVDVDLRPRWKNGPELGLKGDFLESSLEKTEEHSNGWTTTKGLRGKLRAEVRTDRASTVDIEGQAFKRWEGPLNKDYQGRFEVAVGLRNRLTGGEEQERGLTVAANFRQEIEGGEFNFREQKYRWYLEGRQQVYHNLETGRTDADYRVMVGPKRDIELPLFGRKRKFSIAVGPELKGSTAKGRDSLDVGLKVRLRTRF